MLKHSKKVSELVRMSYHYSVQDRERSPVKGLIENGRSKENEKITDENIRWLCCSAGITYCPSWPYVFRDEQV